MIKTFIDLSCKYGIVDDKQYLLIEFENINDVTNSRSNILTSFKSTINSNSLSQDKLCDSKNTVSRKYYIENLYHCQALNIFSPLVFYS